mmetsp:Transcript_29160/g.78907  ORF Transcript_29160/g.78907 Transcript_29160/m.78907 type:complete len:301 (+) Transcript_29160:228-1130(+)
MPLDLIDTGVEDSLGEDLLGDLGSHIGISELSGNENTANFGIFTVDLVDFHLNTSSGDIECLVVLTEEFVITFLSGLKTGKSDSHIVSGGTTTSLRVKEETGTVGRNREVSSHLETRLEGITGSLGDKVLDSEEEWNTFTSRELDGGGGVINTFLLLEDDGTSRVLDVALNSVQSVGLTGHDLGVDKFLLGLSSPSDFFLDGPCLGFDAHLDELLAGGRLDAVLSDDFRASVGKTSSLNLQVGKRVGFGLGQGLGRRGHGSENNGSGNGGLSGSHEVVLERHLKGRVTAGRRSRGKGRSR